MVDDQLLISELAERAGVSVRTIRFYISEGLLPPPQAHGRYSVYDEEYLTRIELIKLLKNAYLPLKQIKRMVESLSRAEIESMLHKLGESPATPTPSGAQASAPEPGPAPQASSGGAGASPNSAGASPNSAGIKEGGLPEALNYISRVLKSQSAPAVSAAPPAPHASRPLAVSQGAPPGRSLARASQSAADAYAGAPPAQPEEGESSWRRYTIRPGVELLVSEQVYNQSAPSIGKIVAQVKQLFSTHPSGGQDV
jgi:DNA-binding transcriptional MerR regulator